MKEQRLFIEEVMKDRDQLLAERDSEVQMLRVQLQALQNYMTNLIVERQ